MSADEKAQELTPAEQQVADETQALIKFLMQEMQDGTVSPPSMVNACISMLGSIAPVSREAAPGSYLVAVANTLRQTADAFQHGTELTQFAKTYHHDS